MSENLKGRRQGLWLVTRDLRPDDAKMTGKVWCRCECGHEQSVKAYDLLAGHTNGCRRCTSGPRRLSMPPTPGALRHRQGALRARRRREATGEDGGQASGAGGAA